MKPYSGLIQNILVYFLCVFFTCCDTKSSQIGTNFFRDAALDISFIDSSTVKLATVKFDSLITNNASRVLIGTYLDEKLGRLSAYTYFLPSLEDVSKLGNTNIYFDRLSIVLKYDGYSYQDTSIAHTLYVRQLDNKIKLLKGHQLYNTTDFPIRKTLLGSTTFYPKPNRNDSLEIILESNFSQTFFNKAKLKDIEFKTNERFADYVKGFIVCADTTKSASILGFEATPQLRLYYLDRNEIPTKRKFISFNTDRNFSSTRVKTNRANTKLKSLQDYRHKLAAMNTDNEAYLQAGAGLALRIDIPYLRELKQLENFYITNATLQIQPVRRSYDRYTKLPASLHLYRVNYRNGLLDEYPANAVLVQDLAMGRDSYYEIDATAFVKSQMGRIEQNENALLLLLPDEGFRFGAERVYFANPSYHYKTELRIYYATILN